MRRCRETGPPGARASLSIHRFGGSRVVQYLCETVVGSPLRVLLWFGMNGLTCRRVHRRHGLVMLTVCVCASTARFGHAHAHRGPPARYCTRLPVRPNISERVMIECGKSERERRGPETWSHARRAQEGRPHKFERNGNARHFIIPRLDTGTPRTQTV